MSSGSENPWEHARPKFKRQQTARRETSSQEDSSRSSESPADSKTDGGLTAKPVRSPRFQSDDTRNAESRLTRVSRSNPTEASDVRASDAAAAESLAAEAQVTTISSGRQLAWLALQIHDHSQAFLQDILAELDARHQLHSGDRAAAVDISAGVIRRRRTIDALLRSQISRPRQNIENDLWRLLQLGVFQLVFGRTPDHAAVDSTVELCRQLGRERWTKFVNGVLRGVGRLLVDEISTEPEQAAIPLTDGRWRRLQRSIAPDRERHFAEWLAESFSLPDSLALRWASRMTPSDCVRAAFYTLEAPRLTLRINRLRSDVATATGLLEAEGCTVEPGTQPYSLRLIGGSRVERLPGFVEGLWSVQDEAAMAAALLLAPQPGEQILDLCAAPGGKSCHLAELAGDQCAILACDVSEGRLHRVRQNADRLRLASVTTQLVDRMGTDLPAGPFDAILVDVPCSNTGVLGRRPEARWRFDEHELQDLAALQTRLLHQACERLKTGGRIVYSTCSIEPEENQQVVEAVLQSFPDIRLKCEQFHVPGSPADGAYQALLIRTSRGMSVQT